MLKPTVLYAEKHSKAILSKSFSGSKMEMKKIPKPIATNDSETIANALRIEMSATSLLNISILSFPLAKLQKFKEAIAKVLVFIPPPVEAGEAPIHIKRKITINVEKFRLPKSMLLKPAVLGVEAVNNAVTIFP